MKETLHLRKKKTNVTEQILLLGKQVRILKFENKKLQKERKVQLNAIERLEDIQNSDIRIENREWLENSTPEQEQKRFG